MLDGQVTLVTVLADGSGTVFQASADDSDGGFTRYRLGVQPWLGFLAQSSRSVPWQEKTVPFIVDSVVSRYARLGSARPLALRAEAGDQRFLLTRVKHVGINNLPKANAALERQRQKRKGSSLDDVFPSGLDPELRRRAVERGYANHFEAIRASVPWRPLLPDGSGARWPTRPRVAGPLTATVVDADGSRVPQGAHEVHTDRLGRVRIRYDFQDADDGSAPGATSASTWVRVLQPLAGDGVGTGWIPRIGHEVLVGFFDDDIDRPYVICSLYNGRGAGGETPTPGGAAAAEADMAAFSASTDATPDGQGNETGGASPAWHGGAAAELDVGGQRNAAALSGYKTKEFGGSGFNQLVFDDSTAQLRVQLATTQHATQLNLGHLIHQADNHRGSFRGVGFELRTDAYGAVRGGSGVLLTTYRTSAADPAGDNAAGVALARQWNNLAGIFDRSAMRHQTVRFSGVIGTGGTGQSAADNETAPIPAWLRQTSGMVAAHGFDEAQADAAQKATATEKAKVPHGTEAVISVSARAGLAMLAGHDAVFASEENVQLGSGQDIDTAAGGAFRLHTGQAIGILGGAVNPGEKAAGTGLTMIAGAGDIDVQAQAGTLQMAALADLNVQSQSSAVNWAAAKKITITVEDGASIVIEGGNVTFECPGTLTVRAGKKSFVGAETVPLAMPTLPRAACKSCLMSAMKQGAPGVIV